MTESAISTPVLVSDAISIARLHGMACIDCGAVSRHPAVRPDDVFYSWTARDGQARGVYVLTSDGPQATVQLFAALLDLAPGAVGDIRPVRFDHAHPVEHLTARPVVRARRRAGGSFVSTGGV
ncbi:hypothetical protein [Nonomuraea sp. NPDC002799]